MAETTNISSPEPYQPANGTEGRDFMARFCERCKHDADFQRDPEHFDGCEIAARSMVFRVNDPGYPVEWIYGDDGDPTCTAFEALELQARGKVMAAKWFDRLGICSAQGCGRVAVGILRDERNSELGKFCDKCAQARLKAARDAMLEGPKP